MTLPARLLVLVLGCCLLAAAPASAAFKGRNGELAYEGRASSTGSLLLQAPKQGAKARRLPAPGSPADPAFSPLGKRIAFTSRGEIWVMYADGTSARQVTVGPEPSRDPAWSPAADALVFATGYGGDRDLYAIGADGNGLRRLTAGRPDDEAPAWSARNVVVFVRHASSRDGDIYSMPAGGGPVRALTHGAADDRSPAFSPDGRRIVFTRLPAATPSKKDKKPPRRVRELWVMRADGTHSRRLAALPAGVSAPVFSPDGKRVAFAMGRSGRRALYVVKTTGRTLRRVAKASADARAVDWQASGRDPVIAAAGDIACDPGTARFATGLGTATACHMLQTSDLTLKMDLSALMPLGDTQYEDGAYDKFLRSFDPTWGRLKAQMRPAVGNHEYRTPGAAGYFDYFNGPGNFDGPAGRRDRGYYSYDLGKWHVIALNSECSDPSPPGTPYRNDCAIGSPQERWLRDDLATHQNRCTLTYWHHPLFSSGIEGSNGAIQPLFQELYQAGVDVALTGHDHGYERFAPMDGFGNRDGEHGLRQFVIGSGGKNHEATNAPQPNSEMREGAVFGVLELTLRPNGYLWRFASEAGSTFTDAGANACH